MSMEREQAVIRARARAIAGVYKRRGKLVPKPCEKCGDTHVQMHHEDYSKPLDVRWLCIDCHMEEHYPGARERWIAEVKRPKQRRVYHGKSLCSGCYTEPPMSGQRYGRKCHAAYQRKLRARRAQAKAQAPSPSPCA